MSFSLLFEITEITFNFIFWSWMVLFASNWGSTRDEKKIFIGQRKVYLSTISKERNILDNMSLCERLRSNLRISRLHKTQNPLPISSFAPCSDLTLTHMSWGEMAELLRLWSNHSEKTHWDIEITRAPIYWVTCLRN